MAVEKVLAEAHAAKAAGSTRFCMGAAWRSPKERDLDMVCAMVEGVKALGMETCMTLGMLTPEQALRLKGAGLDYYNHNIDTSPEYYSKIITTRTFQDRLDTLTAVRAAGINVCSGGIVGMGEGRTDRIGMIKSLATMPEHPQSVPINLLVQVEGTPLAGTEPLDQLEFVRTIAVARITMPKSMVRLSAGREEMSAETQALCFLAGANSIFYGPKLLTTPNPERDSDLRTARQARHAADGVDARSRAGSRGRFGPVLRLGLLGPPLSSVIGPRRADRQSGPDRAERRVRPACFTLLWPRRCRVFRTAGPGPSPA